MVILAICSFLLACFATTGIVVNKRGLRAVAIGLLIVDVFVASPILAADISQVSVLIVLGFFLAGGGATGCVAMTYRNRVRAKAAIQPDQEL